jgi:hypothetical protein
MTPKNRITADGFRPLKNHVFVTDLDRGPHLTAGGIFLPDDNFTEQGVHPRWGRVCYVGPEVDDLRPGEWIYVEHARWTNEIELALPTGVIRMWRVEYPESVLLAADSDPREAVVINLPQAMHPQSERDLVREKAPAIHRFR